MSPRVTLTKLKDLKAREVSLVNKAANRRRFLILKQEVVSMSDILKSVLETDLENETRVDEVFKAAGMSEEATAAAKGALRLLTSYKDELPTDIMSSLGELGGFVTKAGKKEEGDEAEPDPEELFKKKMDDKCSKCDKVKKADEPKPTVQIRKADGSYDLSSFPEEQREGLALIFKEHDELVEKSRKTEAELKAEQDRRENELYVAKAGEFKNLPIKADEFGPVLRTIAKADQGSYDKLVTVLKAADEGMKPAFKQAGTDQPAPEAGIDPMEKIEKAADQLVQKDASVSKARAVSQILQEHPEWYSEYLNYKRQPKQ